jgi:hypothetical protein
MSRFDNLTKEEVAKQIKQWIIEEGIPVDDFPDVQTDFNFVVIRSNTRINIGFHKTSTDSIIVAGNIHFEEQEQSMFRYTKTKREMLYDLEMSFLQMNLDFILNVNNEQQEFTIEDIKLQKTIYFDGLTKDKLFDVMSAIFNCFKVLKLKFELLGRQHI